MRSPPGLILTNLKHIALAEGFGLNQLDSEIQDAANEKY